jgi:hypothetical protein
MLVIDACDGLPEVFLVFLGEGASHDEDDVSVHRTLSFV